MTTQESIHNYESEDGTTCVELVFLYQSIKFSLQVLAYRLFLILNLLFSSLFVPSSTLSYLSQLNNTHPPSAPWEEIARSMSVSETGPFVSGLSLYLLHLHNYFWIFNFFSSFSVFPFLKFSLSQIFPFLNISKKPLDFTPCLVKMSLMLSSPSTLITSTWCSSIISLITLMSTLSSLSLIVLLPSR